MAASEQLPGVGGSKRRSNSQLHLVLDRHTGNASGDLGHSLAYDGRVSPTGSKASKPLCIPLTSPTLLSPPAVQRRMHNMRRQTLQSPQHRRQSSMVLGVRSTYPNRTFARGGRLEADPPRLSLDSQRAAIRHNGSPTKHGVDAEYMRGADSSSAWSGQRVGSHTRGESCPALNINRIIQSISVSGSSAKAGRQARDWTEFRHSASIETPLPGSALAAMLSPLRSDDDAPMSIAANQNSLDTCHREHIGSALASLSSQSSGRASKRHSAGSTGSLFEMRHWPKTTPWAVREDNGRGSELLATVRTDSGDAQVQLPDRICTSGLRRRISVKQHQTTPDIDCTPPSPPPSEGRRSFHSDAPTPGMLSAQSRPLSWDASPGSSTRCTISSDGAAHKRNNRRSAVIAETLRELESASSDVSDSALEEKEEEKMTITLKGPRKRSSEDAGDGSEVPVPAVYLDGAASLWDHYVAELESSDFDPGIHLKRKRVGQLLRVPWNLEKLLWFGVAICFDALLHVFAIMPARFARASAKLAAGAAHDLALAAEEALALQHVRTMGRVLPAAWRQRLAALGVRIRGAQGEGGGAARWVSPVQLFDFYRGLLAVVTCVVLCRIDAAQMYHAIRAQSSLKLYFIFSALDIFDRLLATFGHDALDALQSTVSDAWTQRRRAGVGHFALAQAYMLVHTLVMFCQAITLNVAVNAYSDQLLSLMISVQFVEIKSAVFKKWEKEMLFQVSCADIVERFQAMVFLFIIIVRNLAELAGSSPLFGAPPASATTGTPVMPTAQPPVSFAAATPSAFTPLVPAWFSIPMVNRIVTPVLMVLGSELLIDWIKHSFVTKLNWIRPEIYSHYIDVLSRDLACSRSGAATRAVPPVTADGVPEVVSNAASDATSDAASGVILDEKIESATDDDYQHVPAHRNSSSEASDDQHESVQTTEPVSIERPRTRSASILSHAAFKIATWIWTSRDTAETLPPRRRVHQRTQSTTRPQLFVDQSSRVARRLGLAPLPLACMVMLMLRQVAHILVSSSRAQHTDSFSAKWSVLDVVGWVALGLIAYALLVWAKLAFSSRLMRFAWIRFREYERRTAESGASMKQFDDATKKPDRDSFFEVGQLIDKEPSEAEWEKQRPKWTMENIERYSLFKSRIT
ncbi:hypothetical protein GGH12_000527 [Coemansia sp. RSA 1822]|nr:hypothetical protein LPJ76_000810 [Coemansia sp. RSA 638]KAJ2123467.1 hypothetical protein IW147_002525 [Coemansia sp. RSA 720]KAJ2545217.1 hypothetical protein GGF49_000650 [Coemansia sp. RSA 1853]KAJ2566971.1 hypothetical protein GGH12_000527 [Coemansia sp. RSA 1822]